jgi:PhoH-like ATPase
LASALDQVLAKKTYKKIYIFKNVIEIGPSLGYLPGSVSEKINPFTKHLQIMLDQLHELRAGNNDVFLEQGVYNTKYIEILPLTYIRGMNLEDSFVIIEESQNNSRDDMRSLLTRMGKNCKCVCIGDTNQVDSTHLNQMNNGLN